MKSHKANLWTVLKNRSNAEIRTNEICIRREPSVILFRIRNYFWNSRMATPQPIWISLRKAHILHSPYEIRHAYRVFQTFPSNILVWHHPYITSADFWTFSDPPYVSINSTECQKKLPFFWPQPPSSFADVI